ncbi:MAG TPA: hypothetical protein VGN82_14355 [Bosea sp. (in: a-proteobacteria)]|jgi:hypothetical protein|uniref:hypothetical protein n=1 Tax=Bosea sp. (in: a-proteobacteria) TaxID=1871050 RepID=UPI002E0F7347|nr:hypothetical protein [Bosea sp. (in: a-proteobacteria)]
MIDALRDVQTLRGGEFMAACIDAVEQEAVTIRRREEIAATRGQAIELDNMRRAALLAAAADMLSAIRLDGEKSAAAGRAPVNAIIAAVTAGKQTFQQIDRGLPQEEAA